MNPQQDAEQLSLLSIFHFVVAAVMALFSLFPLIHLAIGVAVLTGALDDQQTGKSLPTFVGWLFVIVPAVLISCGLALSTVVAVAGRRLHLRRHYTYCLVVAAIECVFMPFGTVLGVFTILVLNRPSVRESFDQADGSRQSVSALPASDDLPKDPNNPETLVSVHSEVEAAAIVTALAARGVAASTTGSYTGGFRAEAPGDIKVIVRRADLDRAKQSLIQIKQDAAEIDWSNVDVGRPEDL